MNIQRIFIFRNDLGMYIKNDEHAISFGTDILGLGSDYL